MAWLVSQGLVLATWVTSDLGFDACQTSTLLLGATEASFDSPEGSRQQASACGSPPWCLDGLADLAWHMLRLSNIRAKRFFVKFSKGWHEPLGTILVGCIYPIYNNLLWLGLAGMFIAIIFSFLVSSTYASKSLIKLFNLFNHERVDPPWGPVLDKARSMPRGGR